MTVRIGWDSDILDQGVRDEVESRIERALRRDAVADGVDPSDDKNIRDWVRRRCAAGDPAVRDAIDFLVMRHPLESYHEIPYFWECIVPLGNQLRVSPRMLMDDSALEDARDALDDACADRALEDGVDIYSERAVREWADRSYRQGEPSVRRTLLAGAAWHAIHDFELDYHVAPLPTCMKYFAADHVIGALWDRGLYADRPYVEEDEDVDLEWELWSSDFVGRFTSSGNDYEVWDFDEPGDLPPHFHLRRPRSPRKPEICVGIYEPVYVDHGLGRLGLTEREVADLIDFLERTGPIYYRHGRPIPDYTQLHWPEEA